MADWTDYFNAALQAYGAYQKGKDPKFKELPEDPALTALRSKVLGFIDNSPTRNAFGSMLGSQIQNAGQGFTLPQGYNGFKPYSSGQVKYDLSKILPNIYGATANNPTNASTPMGGSVGGPVSSMPNGGGSDMSGTGAQDIQPGMSGRKDRLPNMAPATGGGPGSLFSTPQPFDPNMQGRPGVTSPAGQNPNAIDIKNRNDPGLGSPVGTGAFGSNVDIKGIQAAWANLPPWAKGSIGIAATLIASMMGLPVGVVSAAIKSMHGGQQAPPPAGTNPASYNPSNPTQPVLP